MNKQLYEVVSRNMKATSTLRRLVVLGALGAGFVIRLVGIGFTSQTSVIGTPLPDDAYYYFSLARNIATGKGVLVASSPVATTGFQPLWGFLLAGIYRVSGELSPAQMISLAQLIGAIAGIASGYLVYLLALQISKSHVAALLTLGTFCFSPQIIKYNINGMETSLTILAVLVIFYMFVLFLNKAISSGQVFVAGLVSGFAILARVDVMLVVALLVLFLVIVELTKPSPRWPIEIPKKLVLFGFACLLPLLPWLWFSVSVGGGLVPESGTAVGLISQISNHLPLVSTAKAVLFYPGMFIPYYISNAVEFTSAWARQVPVLLPMTIPLYAVLGVKSAPAISCVLVIALILFLFRATSQTSDRVLFFVFSIWLFYMLAMTLAYSVIIQGQWFYDRYAAPVGVLLNILIIAVLILIFRLNFSANPRFGKHL